MSIITLSEKAAARVKQIQAADGNPSLMLRVTVNGGGCSGFQYSFSLDDTKLDGDLEFSSHGVVLISDSTSVGLIDGSEIDYVEEMVGAAFVIKNPNAASSCGCGNSFSI